MNNKELTARMKEWRHYLHAHPETALEEKMTSEYIADILRNMGLEVHTGIGVTGVVAVLKAGDGKEVIGLRADFDAINLEEKGEPPYKSQNPGKMHGCGHDGHTATLLGAAELLSESRDFNGTVCFVFQPAEEPGKGAMAMINDGVLEHFAIDEMYGMHNMPQLPAGTINTRPGGIGASEDNFIITITGRGSHASLPHLGIDPIVIAAEIIMGLQTIVSRLNNPLNPAVISCTELFTDGAHNAIPTTVTIKGDTRSYSKEMQEFIEEKMRAVSEGVCGIYGAECRFVYTHEFAPNVNWESCVGWVEKAAERVVGKENVDTDCEPLMGSEDFGAFIERIPGCFVFLGSGKSKVPSENVPLHNSLFDYNDDILETGARFFAELIRIRLPK